MLFFSNIRAQNFDRISKEILQCQVQKNERCCLGASCKGLIERAIFLKNVHNKHKQDTIFLLEIYGDPAYSTLYSIVWNKSDTIYYEVENYGEGKLIVNEKNYMFPEYMCYLVSKWDYDELRKEGEMYGNFIISEYVNATRIIITNRKYQIECMRFKFFYNPDRDWLYF